MIEFYIDQRAVEITPECTVTLSASLEQITNPSSIHEKSFRMRIPMTQHNRKVMGFCEQILSPQQFNQQKHSGKIESGGSLLAYGPVKLIQCEETRFGNACYVIDLIIAPPGWITESRQKKLKEIAMEYNEIFSPALIQDSWTNGSAIRFLPVKRDKHTAYGQGQVVLSALSFENYHPFVQVKTLLETIIEAAGYRIESQFLNEAFFESLYMSGNYPPSGDAKIEPAFYSMPSVGNKVVLASLFDHEQTQLQFIQAIGHLFGLHIYTDEWSKTVYIEPRFTFLNQTHEIDWTDKIDTNSPILVEEPGNNHYQIETYSYKSGDATVDRWEGSHLTSFGKWDALVENRFAKTGKREMRNPLFTATIEEKNSLTSAENASMIVAGNRDSKESNLNFPAKIVRYAGMKELPDGQHWGWPSYGKSYPLVLFHSAGEDWFTLRFDDKDGQLGLRNYYQPLYDFINKGKKVTLNLRLSPPDMEAILYPNSANHNFRGNFVFDIRGEKIKGRLLDVSGYNPDNGGMARCTFAVEL